MNYRTKSGVFRDEIEDRAIITSLGDRHQPSN